MKKIDGKLIAVLTLALIIWASIFSRWTGILVDNAYLIMIAKLGVYISLGYLVFKVFDHVSELRRLESMKGINRSVTHYENHGIDYFKIDPTRSFDLFDDRI